MDDKPSLPQRIAAKWRVMDTRQKRVAAIASLVALFFLSGILSAAGASLRGCRAPDTHHRHTVEQLVAQAEYALEDLNTPGRRSDRRPAIFDSVLRPVDMLLAKSRDALRDAALPDNADDPRRIEEDFTLAIQSARAARDLAARGQDLAFELSNPNNPRQFRFPDQRAEAGRHVATALWARLRRKYAREFDRDPDFQPPTADLDPLLAEIAAGLSARSGDKELRYLEGTVKLIAGDFAGAADAFRRTVEVDPQYGAAYAGLGNAYIGLRDLDRAEKAFLDQITVGRKELAAGRGSDILLGGLCNMAMFHDNLAEASAAPDADPSEDRRRVDEHRRKALNYYLEFLRTPGSESDPSLPSVRERAAFLGRETGGT